MLKQKHSNLKQIGGRANYQYIRALSILQVFPVALSFVLL